ncbi:hypothetical protein WNY78_11460 [Psychroserpens sp. AS72]|uniref:hypothetical protein n=1 Tax=Psychroserpens sp. AS72 TaxID=3135775 RepID=UPI0031738B76
MLKNKEALFIFSLFLIFFPAYAVLNNAIIFILDLLFTNGDVSKIFNYNYTGNLVGCLGHAKLLELKNTHNFSIVNGIIFVSFLISLSCWLILLIKRIKVKYSIWVLIFLFSLFLYTSLQFISIIIFNYKNLDLNYFQDNYLITITSIITVILAIHLFLKRLSKKEKLQLLILVVPSSFISAILWLGYIGPALMPL